MFDSNSKIFALFLLYLIHKYLIIKYMQEIWIDIEGYGGCYQASNFGRVKSLKYNHTFKERILKASKDKKGYLIVCLCKDGIKKSYKVHRLIALTFIPNPDNLPEINHKDEDKTNNRIENLEWCDRKHNVNFGSRTKRMVESKTNYPKFSKQVLCVETGKIYPSIHQVERELGFLHGNISLSCNGKIKSAYGYTWRYV